MGREERKRRGRKGPPILFPHTFRAYRGGTGKEDHGKRFTNFTPHHRAQGRRKKYHTTKKKKKKKREKRAISFLPLWCAGCKKEGKGRRNCRIQLPPKEKNMSEGKSKGKKEEKSNSSLLRHEGKKERGDDRREAGVTSSSCHQSGKQKKKSGAWPWFLNFIRERGSLMSFFLHFMRGGRKTSEKKKKRQPPPPGEKKKEAEMASLSTVEGKKKHGLSWGEKKGKKGNSPSIFLRRGGR